MGAGPIYAAVLDARKKMYDRFMGRDRSEEARIARISGSKGEKDENARERRERCVRCGRKAVEVVTRSPL